MSVALVGALVVPALAQEKPELPKGRPPATALRAQVVFSRQQGERKIVSRPYSFTFSTSKNVLLRQGTEVPVPVTQVEKDGKDTISFQYKNVGVNIHLTAEPTEGGRFLLNYSVEDSSMWDDQSGTKPGTPQAPAFNTFNLSGQLLLRDGESAASTTTHAVSGEITKLEITLNVLK